MRKEIVTCINAFISSPKEHLKNEKNQQRRDNDQAKPTELRDSEVQTPENN